MQLSITLQHSLNGIYYPTTLRYWGPLCYYVSLMGPITQLHFGNCVYYATTLDYRKSQNNYPLLTMQTHFFRRGNYWDHEFREKGQNSRYLPCNFVIKLGEFRLGETIPTKNFWRGQNFQGELFRRGIYFGFYCKLP